jgi:hypothetical protein
MLLQKNLPVRPTYGASDKILKQEGLILADANLAGIAHLVVNLRRTANTVATQGFADGSPVPALLRLSSLTTILRLRLRSQTAFRL